MKLFRAAISFYFTLSIFGGISVQAQNQPGHPFSRYLKENYGISTSPNPGNRPHHILLPLVSASGAQVVFVSPSVIEDYGIAENRTRAEAMGREYGFWVDPNFLNSLNRDFTTRRSFRWNHEKYGSAFAYVDGFGAQGDGRSLLFEELNTRLGIIDIGGKGTGATPYRIPVREVHNGRHIGEIDGLMSSKEFLVSYLVGEYLNSFQIQSDRMLWGIELDKTTGHNIERLNIEGESRDILKAMIGVRAMQNAMRLGMVFRGRGGFTVDLGGDRNDMLEMFRARENSLYSSNNRMDRNQAFLSGVARWGAMAARAQDMHIIHNSPNDSNLTWGGWTDLLYVNGLRAPDPHWRMAMGSLSAQPVIFFFYVYNFWRFFADVENGEGRLTVERDVFDKTFWETYKKEYTRLTLIRLGFTDRETRDLIERQGEKANRLAAEYWKLSRNYLQTDLHRYMIERISGKNHTEAARAANRSPDLRDHNGRVVENHRGEPMNIRAITWQRIQDAVGEYFTEYDNTDNRRRLTAALGNGLLHQLEELAAENLQRRSGFTRAMIENSERVMRLRFPSSDWFHGQVAGWKNSGQPMAAFLDSFQRDGEGEIRGFRTIRQEVTEIYGRQSPYLPGEVRAAPADRPARNRRQRSSEIEESDATIGVRCEIAVGGV